MRLVFAGTPAFAATALDALVAAGHEIVLVLTQPDRPSGRGLAVHPTPVKTVAAHRAIAVLQAKGLRLDGRHAADAVEAHERLRAVPHDAMIVAAYGLILPPSVLSIPSRGCINIHASLLPRWRGAAPVQRAIEAGDAETGITIMQMDAGLDTGAILLIREIAIAPDDSAGTLTDRLAALGGIAIVEALKRMTAGTLASRPQHAAGEEAQVTYAAKLSKTEAQADFTLDGKAFVDRVRAFDPWPGSNAELHDPAASTSVPFKIWKAVLLGAAPADAMNGGRVVAGDVIGFDVGVGVIVATGGGPIALTELQKPGGRRLPASHFVRDFVGKSRLRFLPG